MINKSDTIFSGVFSCNGLSAVRMGEEHKEIINSAIERFWRAPPKSLTDRIYHFNGNTISVHIDWQSFSNEINKFARALSSPHKFKSPEHWLKRLRRTVNFGFTVSIDVDKKTDKNWGRPSHFVDIFIHEIFLIANLATPGCISFRGSSITEQFPTEISLDCGLFEQAWLDSLNGRWPTVEALPRQDVLDWFESLNLNCKQLPETGIEKALYALLHIAKDDARIESIVWIIHGLEGLISANPGENFSGMVRRLSMILDLSSSQQMILKKKLGELYKLRSAFVHGGYLVPHPLHNEVLDERLNDRLHHLYTLIEFGFALLVSTLQILVKKRIISLQFEEKIVIKTTCKANEAARHFEG